MSTTVDDTPSRLAVLEEIARGTKDALRRIESRLETIAADQRSDFRMLVRFMAGLFGVTVTVGIGLLGVMAHGFHWL